MKVEVTCFYAVFSNLFVPTLYPVLTQSVDACDSGITSTSGKIEHMVHGQKLSC